MGRDFGWLLSSLERAVGYPIRAPNEAITAGSQPSVRLLRASIASRTSGLRCTPS